MPPIEPTRKRTLVFVDGQNLFHAARESFGYPYPNYDVQKLADALCRQQGWVLTGVRFYTGVPDARDNAFWNHFWNAKLARMGWQGVVVFSRPLRYRHQTLTLPDGRAQTVLVGREKGIDVRIALDVVHFVRTNACDVALVLSQDQDLSELADEVRLIARDQGRWFKIASAFPFSPTTTNRRGINKTDWVKIERATYDACLDPRDYRPPRP
jgi:uncharacterized LabA/DUF88 family protein